MARKEKYFVVTTEGRDKDKMFYILEMPALKAERWAFRALQALAASGVELPDNFSSMPMAQMAAIGIKALANVSFEVAEPLLDEMMSCVQYVPNKQKKTFTMTLDVADDAIEEVSTAFQLRKETMMLHLGFFTDEEDPTLA